MEQPLLANMEMVPDEVDEALVGPPQHGRARAREKARARTKALVRLLELVQTQHLPTRGSTVIL